VSIYIISHFQQLRDMRVATPTMEEGISDHV